MSDHIINLSNNFSLMNLNHVNHTVPTNPTQSTNSTNPTQSTNPTNSTNPTHSTNLQHTKIKHIKNKSHKTHTYYSIIPNKNNKVCNYNPSDEFTYKYQLDYNNDYYKPFLNAEYGQYEQDNITYVRKSIPKSLKDKLWDVSYGPDSGSGECYVCKTKINSKRFEAGHIIPVSRGGDTVLSNLKCICSTCNKAMGNQHLEIFKNKYFPNVCYYCKKTKNLFQNKCNENEKHTDFCYHIECKSTYYNKLVDIHGINNIFLFKSNCILCIQDTYQL